MNLKTLRYVLYIIGFTLILGPIFLTDFCRENFGDFITRLLLSIGCVVTGSGKALLIAHKKDIEETYTTDIIIMVAFFALAGFNLVR